MAIEGPLRELGIHDVFQLLDLSRKTGELRVSSTLREDEGVVLFDKGRVVQATIRSRPQVDETGAFSERELDRKRRAQIQQAVFELMSWSEGFFSFEDRSRRRDGGRIRASSVSTESLLMEGARRIDEWSRIADIIPNVDVIAELAPVEDDREGAMLDLLPHEWQVLTMIDGMRDLRGIAAALPRDEFDVARIAYGLATTGVITIRPPSRFAIETHRQGAESLLASARALTRAGRHADAFEELRRAVQEDPLTPRVHFEFGCAAARVGDFASASASWEHVLRLTPEDAVGAQARAALRCIESPAPCARGPCRRLTRFDSGAKSWRAIRRASCFSNWRSASPAGTDDVALKIAMRGMERHPSNADAHDLMARIAVDRREFDRAISEWETVLRVEPGHLGAMKGLGYVSFQQGRLDDAERYLSGAAAQGAGSDVTTALDTVSTVVRRAGRRPIPTSSDGDRFANGCSPICSSKRADGAAARHQRLCPRRAVSRSGRQGPGAGDRRATERHLGRGGSRDAPPRHRRLAVDHVRDGGRGRRDGSGAGGESARRGGVAGDSAGTAAAIARPMRRARGELAPAGARDEHVSFATVLESISRQRGVRASLIVSESDGLIVDRRAALRAGRRPGGRARRVALPQSAVVGGGGVARRCGVSPARRRSRPHLRGWGPGRSGDRRRR